MYPNTFKWIPDFDRFIAGSTGKITVVKLDQTVDAVFMVVHRAEKTTFEFSDVH